MPSIRLQDYAVGLLDRPERTIAIYGGRGGGKTIPVATVIALRCLQVPNTEAVIVREFKKAGEDGALKAVFNAARAVRPKRVRMTKVPSAVLFDNGSAVTVLGSERNVDNLRDNLNTADITWFEESHTLSKEANDTARPSIRAPGAKLIYTFNPHRKDDEVSQRFIENPIDDAYILKVNYGDYPDFSNEASRH